MIFCAFADGKYFERNFSQSFPQVSMPVRSKLLNQSFAWLRSEKPNMRIRIVSCGTPFYLMVSQISRKVSRCAFGSFVTPPPNCSPWTILIRAGFNSKLFASTCGPNRLLGTVRWEVGTCDSEVFPLEQGQ